MLTVAGLCCIRGERNLFLDVSFELQSGGLLYIHGENGSGKSSLLRLISGLMIPEEGSITWNGGDIHAHADHYRQHLLYIGHLNALKEDLTAEENLAVAAGLSRQYRNTTQIESALAAVGLAEYAQQPVKQLSQGQKRRVTLARLWLSSSRLWLLDEPFAALDQPSQRLLAERIAQHLAEGGMAILVTHQAVEIAATLIQELSLAQ